MAKAKGTATITAKVGSKKFTCKVKVDNPVTSKVPSCVSKQTVYAVAPNGGLEATMTKRTVLDSPESFIYIKNLDSLKSGDSINVLFHTTKKPANYKTPKKWFGQVPSPLHKICTLVVG